MIKKTMLAAATAALCLAALPGLAAADPHMDLPQNPHFTFHSGEVKFLTEVSLSCKTGTGTGEFENRTTGWVEFTFEGCKGPFGIHCGNEETGNILAETLPFHLRTTEGEPVVLITPNANGHIATFACSAFFSITWGGNGIVGAITAPGYNEESNTATIAFSGEEGEQDHATVDGSETEWGLEMSINGGEPGPLVLFLEGTLAFAEEGEGELTEE